MENDPVPNIEEWWIWLQKFDPNLNEMRDLAGDKEVDPFKMARLITSLRHAYVRLWLKYDDQMKRLHNVPLIEDENHPKDPNYTLVQYRGKIEV